MRCGFPREFIVIVIVIACPGEGAETGLAEAQQSHGDTLKELSAGIEFFDQAKAACEAKHAEWEARKGNRSPEVEGIEEALKISTSHEVRELVHKAIKPGQEPIFLQLGRGDYGEAAKAYHALKAQAAKTHSHRHAALTATVRTAAVGHFDWVCNAIDEITCNPF